MYSAANTPTYILLQQTPGMLIAGPAEDLTEYPRDQKR
jgi:hypothetical protein